MPVPRLDFRNHRLPSVLLAILFLVSMTNFLRSAWDLFGELLHGDRYVSTSFGLQWPSFKVDALDLEAERAGLRKGDVVLRRQRAPGAGVVGHRRSGTASADR